MYKKGNTSWNKGKKASIETREKLSKMRMGNKYRLGIKHTEEIKKQISLSLKGRKPWNAGKELSAEHKEKVSKAMKGRTFSEETRKKLSEAARKWKRKPFSEEHIRKLKEARAERVFTVEMRRNMSRGLKLSCVEGRNKSWKGGITPVNMIIRASSEYKLWREAVFKRDNYTCLWCGLKGGTMKNENGKWITIQADHIKPFSLYPELRFAIDNGRTLCILCHRKTDTYGSKIRFYEKK